jgi:DinB family protein
VETWATVLWGQFGASIDTLGNAIAACPDVLWDDGSEPPQLFWYGAYHCIFYLDHYLSESEEGFAPPAPFGLTEFDPSGALPERTYTKKELLGYLAHARAKCRARMATLSDEDVHRRCGFAMRNLTVAELFLYTMRHVQHHAAQLNLLLRQKTGAATPWVSKAKAT